MCGERGELTSMSSAKSTGSSGDEQRASTSLRRASREREATTRLGQGIEVLPRAGIEEFVLPGQSPRGSPRTATVTPCVPMWGCEDGAGAAPSAVSPREPTLDPVLRVSPRGGAAGVAPGGAAGVLHPVPDDGGVARSRRESEKAKEGGWSVVRPLEGSA